MKAIRLLGLIMLITLIPVSASANDDETPAEDPASVMIIELQTESTDSASQEFIELYNTTDAPIELADWEVQYKSATGTEWRTKASLTDTIEPRGRYLLASKDYLDDIADSFSNATSLGLAGAAGNVRVVQVIDVENDGVEESIDEVVDEISWGAPDLDEDGENLLDDAPDVMQAHDEGQSLKRLVDEDGYFIDSDSSFADWFTSDLPTPTSDDAPPDADVDSGGVDGSVDDQPDDAQGQGDPADDQTDTDDQITPVTSVGGTPDDGNSGQSSYPRLVISELFPDPVSPQRDGDDEFIEIHNPNSYAVNLLDWQLQSGNTNRYKFTFPAFTLAAGQYAAFSIQDTGNTLSNSGSRARLLDPNGVEVYATAEYGDAEGGQTFALTDSGAWAWTTTVTPSRANVFTGEADDSDSDDSSSASGSGSASGSVTTASAERSGISGLVTSDTDSTEGRNIFKDPAAIDANQTNRRLIIALLAGTAIYAIWQYRQDALNLYHRIKAKRQDHQTSRKK